MLNINQGFTVMPNSAFSYLKKSKEKKEPFPSIPFLFSQHNYIRGQRSFRLFILQISKQMRGQRAGFCPHTVTLFLLAPAANWNQNEFQFRPQLAIWQQEAATEHNLEFPSISAP